MAKPASDSTDAGYFYFQAVSWGSVLTLPPRVRKPYVVEVIFAFLHQTRFSFPYVHHLTKENGHCQQYRAALPLK